MDDETFIDYAVRTCDSFCLVVGDDQTEFLYGKDKEFYDRLVADLEPYLMKKESFGTFISPYTGSGFYDGTLCRYRCCPQTKEILLRKPDPFDWIVEENAPEELCFFRGEKVWYVCLAHEGEDWYENVTEEDSAFYATFGLEFFDYGSNGKCWGVVPITDDPMDNEKFIDYAIRTCDSFCLVVGDDQTENLYGADREAYDKIVSDLEPYLIKKEIISPYAISSFHSGAFCWYRCCPQTKEILLRKDTPFDWNVKENAPEALCFYRGKKVWYECIPNEFEERFTNVTEEDISYFASIGVELFDYYGNGELWRRRLFRS